MRLIRKVWRSDPGSVVFVLVLFSTSMVGGLTIDYLVPVTEEGVKVMLSIVVFFTSFFGANKLGDVVDSRLKKYNNSA